MVEPISMPESEVRTVLENKGGFFLVETYGEAFTGRLIGLEAGIYTFQGSTGTRHEHSLNEIRRVRHYS